MARQTLNYSVTDDGRDAGKIYVLTEMSASQGERWAIRALMALMAGNVDIPDGYDQMGVAGLAEVGMKMLTGLKWEVAEPLLDEMWQCVKFMPDPSKPHIIRALFEEDIEEISTRLKLRAELLKMHADFLRAVAPSIFNGETTASK